MAKAGDNRRKASSRNYKTRYEQIGYKDLFCLGSGQIQFSGGVSVIVGGNGVGKSTLAAALGELIESGPSEILQGYPSILTGSSLSALIWDNGQQRSRTVEEMSGVRTPGGDAISLESAWLDAAYLAFKTRMRVLGDSNFSEVIEPLTPLQLGQADLASLSYVVGKNYDECKVYEIVDYAELDRFPYFVVKSHGVQYGSERMGQGELALMLMLWVVRDLPRDSMLILEEPESHVSPRAQSALMSIITEAAANKGLWTVITTHSPVIAAGVPLEHIRMLSRDRERIVVNATVHRHQVASILGGESHFGGIAVVEDEVAKELTISILDEYAPDVLRLLEILPVAGESNVTKILSTFPGESSWFRLMGIYDGDQRATLSTKDIPWPHIFLPGVVDPAALLVGNFLSGDNQKDFAQELHKEESALTIAIDSLSGLEHHDWITEASKKLIVSKADITRALFRLWSKSESAKNEISQFVEGLKQAYDSGAIRVAKGSSSGGNHA